ITLPFRFAFGHSLATRRSSDNVYVRVTLNDGTVGYGEGVPRDYVTGETTSSALHALSERLAPSVIGRDVSSVDEVPALLKSVVEHDMAAWCALELAVLDAFGRHFGCSVSYWLTDGPTARVRYDAIIPFGGAPQLAVLGSVVRALCFRNAKLKVGPDLERDARHLAV